MDFKFIDSGWNKIFQEISTRYKKEYKLITPFVQLNTIKEMHRHKKTKMKLITRTNLNDFYNGVSSLEALEYIIKNGGEVKGIKNLHSKLYVFDSTEAVLASANLTQSALLKNFEFGMQTANVEAMKEINNYFEKLWSKIPEKVKISDLRKWTNEIDSKLKKGKGAYKIPKFKDYGHKLEENEEESFDKSVKNILGKKQYFVKFWGKGTAKGRVLPSFPIWDEVDRSGCHWACSYPGNKKPRSVNDGDIMFMGRLTKNPGSPNDIMIFGYAIASKYKEGRDDATPEEIKLRSFKAHWSRYIRVHDAKFIDGQMSNGVSLNELMKEFKSDSFLSTSINKSRGMGNTNPRKAYSQQAAVQLTNRSATWLLEQLDDRIQKIGRISDSRFANLD